MASNIIIAEDVNFLSPTGYRMTIDRLKDVSYYVQKVSLPGVSLGYSDVSTPHRIVAVPGENLDYEVFSADFVIDEKMKNFREIYEWVRGLSFPGSRQEFIDYIERVDKETILTDELSKMVSDGMLEILDSSNNPVVRIRLIDMFPIFIGQPHFDSTLTEFQYLTGRVDFKIDRFEFVD